MPAENTPAKIDIRIYVGMLFFRWKIIVVCFLYCLLGAVIYLNVTPKKFRAYAKIMAYRDPTLEVSKTAMPWASREAHQYLLQGSQLRGRAADLLMAEWGERMGARAAMVLPVTVWWERGLAPTMAVMATSENRDYAIAFLNALVDEHRKEWQSLQANSIVHATQSLSDELAKLDERIRQAEDDLIEYQRLHDMARVQARAAMEGQYLGALIGRRHQLDTELAMLEYEFPRLKDANVGVVSEIGRLNRGTASVKPLPKADGKTDEGDLADSPEFLPEELRAERIEEAATKEDETVAGWPEVRVKMARLEQHRAELLKNLRPEHPQVRAVDAQIGSLHATLEVAAQVGLQSLMDRHRALKLQLDAVESAEYQWQAKNLFVWQRQAEYKRVQSNVARFENNYNTLFARLHDIRVAEQIKAERFSVAEWAAAESTPYWPDAKKILLIALAMGLGSGFGLALLLQVTDNKVQSIKDVEKELGIPFLGGVPYWAHSGLEKAIRPIVTEENASGAIEAYRALRTSLLTALGKINEKVVLVTSADSREGKTLTALNIAIMIAQMGKRVLLVDLDLRRGRLHRSLGATREPGMSDALSQHGSLRGVVQKTRVDNLWLIPTGSLIENASELLQASDMVGIFAEIQEDYDYILIDTSPVLRVTDTVIAATQGVGVVVYVARVNRTSKSMIQYSLDMLKDARVIGLIMNSIEMHRLSSLYYAYQYPNYAYYSNAYVYGYNYHHDDGVQDRGGWGSGIGEFWHGKLLGISARLRRLLSRGGA